MLSTDVGAAPAASTIQDAAPFVGAGRRDAGPSSDDFATVFDRCAGASKPDSTVQTPPRTLPKGSTAQAGPSPASFAGASVQDAVSDASADGTPAGLAAGLDMPTDLPDDGETEVDDAVEVIDPRLFVQVCLPVMQKPEAVPSTPGVPDGAISTSETPTGNGFLTAQARTTGLPAHARGPIAAFGGLTPRPMGPATGGTSEQAVSEPVGDEALPMDVTGVAVGEVDPQATAPSAPTVVLTPEEQAAVDDAIARLAVGSPTAGTPGVGAASDTPASPDGAVDSGVAPADPRATAFAAIRAALSATNAEGQRRTAPAVDAFPADSAADAQASTLVAEPETTPRGLTQAVASTPQAAMTGLHRAAAHAAKPVPAPDSMQPGDPSVSLGEPDVPVPTVELAAGDASAATPVTGEGDVRETRAAQAQPVATPNAALAAAQAEAPAAQAVRQRSGHQETSVPPAPQRPSARAAHAIAAFQAVANAGGGTTAATQGAFAAAGPAPALLDQELPTQIVQAIRVQFDNGSGEARVRLNPGFLGGMTVGVKVDGASVVASLQASSADVREWMQRNEQVLRQALADQGLHLERLVIIDEESRPTQDDQRGDGKSNQQQQEQASSRRPRRPADEGTFELEL